MTTTRTTTSSTHAPSMPIVATLMAIPVIMVLGNSMIIPVMPQISKVLGVSSFQVSLLITLFSLPAAIVIPIAGILADRAGRKRVILWGLLIYGLGGILAGVGSLWHSYLFILVSRIIQGIGAAGTAPIAMVLVSDLYAKEQRSKALGMIEASNAMGKVISPIFGSLVALISWYAMFFIFPLFCLPVAIAMWKLVPEPTSEQAPPALTEYREKVKKTFQRQGKWLTAAFITGAVTMFTTFGFLFYLSNFLEDTYHITGISKGLVLAIPLLAICITAYFTGSYIKEHARKMKLLILWGLAVLTGTMIFIPWIHHVVPLMALSVGMGMGNGLILPCLNNLIVSAVGMQERGIITSLYGSVRFFGVALGPPVFGALKGNLSLLFIGTAVGIGIAWLLALFLIHRPQRLRGKDGHSRLLLHKKRLHPVS